MLKEERKRKKKGIMLENLFLTTQVFYLYFGDRTTQNDYNIAAAITTVYC